MVDRLSYRRTEHLLLAQYEDRALIPIDWVVRDFFPHLTREQLLRNINEGRITLPVTRSDASAKAAKFVATEHLAEYLDGQIASARKEARQLAGAARGA